MGRLTSHFDYCELFSCPQRNPELAKVNQCNFFNTTSRDKCHEKAVYDKLREYEDLEEQGLLLKLPFKVGDYVWILHERAKQIECKIVRRISFGHKSDSIHFLDYDLFMIWNKDWCGYIGKKIFLTKEEAEKALAEMEKKDGKID
jgi:hypothetical protein